MKKRQIQFLGTILLHVTIINTSIFSQSFEYYPIYANCKVAPMNSKLKDFKTFDVRLVKYTGLNAEPDVKNMSDDEFSTLLSTVTFNPLKQVSEGGDLHIVVLIQAYAESNSGAAGTGFHVTLYDKYMNEQGAFQHSWAYLQPKDSKKLTSSSNGKAKLKAHLESALEDFLSLVYKWSTEGYDTQQFVPLAQFEKVKKFQDLESFNVVVKETGPVLKKQGSVAWLKEITKDDIEYWQGFVDEKEDTEQNDIKCAALQNLCSYYALNHDEKMARQYLEKYKKVDVVRKDGLVKYNYSIETEKFVNKIFPFKPTKSVLTKELSLAEILDTHQYISIEGSAIPVDEDKVLKETFKGIIKIVKPEPYFEIPSNNGGGVTTLGGKDKGVMIKLYKEKDLINKVSASNIQKITSNDDSREFVVRKFKLLTFTYFTLLERTYKSPKITLYEQVFVEDSPVTQSNTSNSERQNVAPESYFWLTKKGDSEGLQTSVFNLKKRLFEYLIDCPSIKEKYEGTFFNRLNMVEISKDYDKCK